MNERKWADIELLKWKDKPKEIRTYLAMSLMGINTDEKEKSEAKAKLVSPDKFLEGAKKQVKEFGKVAGLSSGYWQIDQMTAGFAPGELTIVLGETSRGKTLTCLNIMANQLASGHKCVFVTLEMTKEEVLVRLMKILGNNLFNQVMGDDCLRFQESTKIPYTSIKNLMKNAKEWGAEIVYIDHLHQLGREMMNQADGLGLILQEAKIAAIDTKLPVVLISHVRKMENTGMRPSANDARGSSYIGQDADVVLSVWQDLEKYPSEHILVGLEKNRNRCLWRVKSGAYFPRQGLRICPTEYDVNEDRENSASGRAKGER